MIYYNSMAEQWEDDNDPTFIVGMTPEGETHEEYNSRGDFWNWYYNVDNLYKSDNGPCWDLHAVYICWHGDKYMHVEERLMVFKDGRDIDQAINERIDLLRNKYDYVGFLCFIRR